MSLQAFVNVAEKQSFSVAAESMHLTQPAISKRISSLESELECRLFDRIGRQTQLTEAGRALLPRAQKILTDVQDSKRAMHNLSETIGGKLSIGTSHHIGLHRLPPTLRQYNLACPDVELDMHFMDSEQACEAVLHGDLELGIVTLPPTVNKPLAHQTLWVDHLQIVVGNDHPLQSIKSTDLETLANYPAILPARGTFTREVIETALDSQDIELNVRLSTNYLETIRMMVSIGLGWSVLPQTMISDDIHALNVSHLTLSRPLGIVRHTERTLSNAALALTKMLSQNSQQ